MQPRDLFDGFLLVVLGISLYLELYGLSVSTGLLHAIVDTILNIDIVVYLIIAGILGVAFVGYIAIYLPRKQSEVGP